jgi:hypothetical protein
VPEVSEVNFNDVGTQAVRSELPFVDIFASGFVCEGYGSATLILPPYKSNVLMAPISLRIFSSCHMWGA